MMAWLHRFPHKEQHDYTETEVAPVVPAAPTGVVQPPECEVSYVEEPERLKVQGWRESQW